VGYDDYILISYLKNKMRTDYRHVSNNQDEEMSFFAMPSNSSSLNLMNHPLQKLKAMNPSLNPI
jgi:hypothetical protein